MPPVLGNESQIREVLTNLVLNAVDAMPCGGTVTITAEPSAGEALLKIQDTGQGMTDEIRRRCLEPFFTTKGAHGTGMGLAMVHGIIKRHSGALEIESEIGKGTAILIRLPLWGDGDAVRDAGVAPDPYDEPRVGLRILVIDDEEWSRSLIAQYMFEAGHTVEVAADGAEQLARVAHHECEWPPIDMSALAAEVAAGVASRNKKRQVEVKIDPELTAVSDPELMTTALSKLFENAWKYTVPVPHAQVAFISAGNEEALSDAGLQLPEGGAGNAETSFAVLDNGVGFDRVCRTSCSAPSSGCIRHWSSGEQGWAWPLSGALFTDMAEWSARGVKSGRAPASPSRFRRYGARRAEVSVPARGLVAVPPDVEAGLWTPDGRR